MLTGSAEVAYRASHDEPLRRLERSISYLRSSLSRSSEISSLCSMRRDVDLGS